LHPLLLRELAVERVEELRREATRGRLALSVLRPSRGGGVRSRAMRRVGFLLVGAGLRLAVAGADRDPAGRGMA
jgi:hypothetical protein